MTARLMFDGDIKPVNFKVAEISLFSILFATAFIDEIEKVDRLIERNQNFSVTPQNANCKLIGRIERVKEQEQAVLYRFVVDQIRVPKRVERALNESIDVSSSSEDKEP